MKASTIFILLLVLLFMGCANNATDFIASENSITNLNNLIGNLSEPETFVVDANKQTDLVTSRGTQISIQANSVFTYGGLLYTGNYDLEVLELYSKGEIMLQGIPTITSSGQILESGGEFKLLTQNLDVIDFGSAQIKVRTDDPNPEMTIFSPVFEGQPGPTDVPSPNLVNFSWQRFNDSSIDIIEDTNGCLYDFDLYDLDWVNIDYFTKFDVELTDIEVKLPSEFTFENTGFWVVFKDRNIVLSSAQNLPIGENVILIALTSDVDGNIFFTQESLTIDKDISIKMIPVETSKDDVKEFLEGL